MRRVVFARMGVRAGVALAVGTFCCLFAADASASCAHHAGKAFAGASIHPARSGGSRGGTIVRATFEESPEPAITGLWRVDFLQDDQVVGQAFETFYGDGNELLIDTENPATDNVCNGIWARTGKHTYRIKHPSWTFDAGGNLTGTAILRTELTLSRNGNRFTGSMKVAIYDVSGNFQGEFEGPVRAQRIVMD